MKWDDFEGEEVESVAPIRLRTKKHFGIWDFHFRLHFSILRYPSQEG